MSFVVLIASLCSEYAVSLSLLVEAVTYDFPSNSFKARHMDGKEIISGRGKYRMSTNF